jgi:hypothetical protein
VFNSRSVSQLSGLRFSRCSSVSPYINRDNTFHRPRPNMYLLTTYFFSLHSTPQFACIRDIIVEYCNNQSIHSFVQTCLYQVQGFRVRSQWPRGLRRGSSAVRFPGIQVRIPAGACKLIFCECCVLPCRGLCVGLITSTEESY